LFRDFIGAASERNDAIDEDSQDKTEDAGEGLPEVKTKDTVDE
jgi:hypothetical protein